MRNIATAGLRAAFITLAALAPGALRAADQQASSGANPNGKLQTPDRAGSANIVGAVTAPLHDLNITRQGIPPVLLAAITDPYDPPSPRDCQEITRQIDALDVALGADLDEPETPLAPSLTRKTGRIALALIHGGAESLLPFAGYVRTLSGAQHHDQLVIEAITAGSVRRGYLKGLGESRGCPRPARPVHFLIPPPPALEDGPKPRYPIR